LTGRNNYVGFSEWSGNDVIAEPGLVSSVFPVEAALYFWEVNDLTRWADRGDIKGLSRRVNGGYNGLAQRMAITHKASDILLA